MKFESKAHLAQELIKGKRFTNNEEFVIYYDPKCVNPFRCNSDEMSHVWEAYYLDIWTEVKERHVHQDLIDSYRKGQAWQYRNIAENKKLWFNMIDDEEGIWREPDWISHVQYRLHPHNELIQAYRNGAKIEYLTKDGWAETTHPTWKEDTQYRIKPVTKIVYEWMYKSKLNDNWRIEEVMLDEEEAKLCFEGLTYRKTGRKFEVEE
jgi:hypothetical protein